MKPSLDTLNQRIDVLNFYLIWTTLIAAILWPFHLFLFAYIVLGPLHYLTEINWLHKQNYFLSNKDSRVFGWSMVALVILVSIGAVLPDTGYWKTTRPLHDAIFNPPDSLLKSAGMWSYSLVMIAFVTAAAWVFTDRWLVRMFIAAFCLISSLWFYTNPVLAVLFGVLLPTIVHVFFFTLVFMLYGTMKTKSPWGYINVASMLLVLLAIAVSHHLVGLHNLNKSVVELTIASSFQQLNLSINRLLGNVGEHGLGAYTTGFWRVQSFIAFAYTYHYLNWFSKTSIIQWHRVEKKKLAFSAVLWLASISLYKIDYRLGFAAITAVSVLHIVLEFPLNVISMKGVLWGLLTKNKTKNA